MGDLNSIFIFVTATKIDGGIYDWLHAILINDKFIEQLNMYEFKTMQTLYQKISTFSQMEFLIEFVKTLPLPKEEKKIPTTKVTESDH